MPTTAAKRPQVSAAIGPVLPAAARPRDEELLRRVASGDGTAFGLLADRLGPIVRRVLFRFGFPDEEVDDILQECLIRVWQGSSDFKGTSTVNTWACRIAVNLAISELRRRKVTPTWQPPAILDTEAAWDRSQQAEVVREAVEALPLRLRTVVILREFEGLPYRTIADILGIPIGTVMSRLHKARARLRRRLEPILHASGT